MKRILVIAAVAAACGGSSGTAVDHNRAGSGSSTLLVTGTVTVTVSDTAPLTSFSVTVKDGLGANLTGATVTVHNSAYGDVALTEAQTGSGVYANSKTTPYPSGDLSLNVVKGTDKVQGVVVGYPGTHAINAPTVNTSVSSTQPLHVSWTTPASRVRKGEASFGPLNHCSTRSSESEPPAKSRHHASSRRGSTSGSGAAPGSAMPNQRCRRP